MAVSLDLTLDNKLGRFRAYAGDARIRMEQAALIASDRASKRARTTLRTQMRGARLGRLGNAFGQTSDLQKTGTVFRRAGGFSASGLVFIRSRSERTLGAIQSYLYGSSISPVRSRYLWIPTDNIPRVSQRFRLTPALWNKNGLDQRIGRLQFIRTRSGTPLLIVKNAPVNQASGRAGPRTKTGRLRRNQVEQPFIVAFVGIQRTSRQARVNANQIFRQVQAEMPQLIAQAIERTRR